jgi:hypothetical protein
MSTVTNKYLTSIELQFRKGSILKWGARLQGEVRSPHDLSIAPNLSHSLLFLYPHSHFKYDIYLAVCFNPINTKSHLADSPSEQDPDQNNKVSSNLDFCDWLCCLLSFANSYDLHTLPLHPLGNALCSKLPLLFVKQCCDPFLAPVALAQT